MLWTKQRGTSRSHSSLKTKRPPLPPLLDSTNSVMPFGLHGTPATFQCLVNTILGDCPTFLLASLDEIIVFIPTWEFHMTLPTTVLQCLQTTGLKINPSKSKLWYQELKNLGYIVGHGCFQPQEEKVSVLHQLAASPTKQQV